MRELAWGFGDKEKFRRCRGIVIDACGVICAIGPPFTALCESEFLQLNGGVRQTAVESAAESIYDALKYVQVFVLACSGRGKPPEQCIL